MKTMMDDEKHKRDFQEVREFCPWRFGEKCRPVVFEFKIAGVSATLKNCEQKNCTPYHFRKFFEGRK